LTPVLDASAIAPLLIPDEVGDVPAGLAGVLASDGAVVPGHWRMEVFNLLLNAERRGRLSQADRADGVRTIGAVIVEVDIMTDERLAGATWALAERHRLSIYDAAYLELALRRELPLASADRRLITAAKAEKVPIF
jgi:predicted nucleic acid-binding protein